MAVNLSESIVLGKTLIDRLILMYWGKYYYTFKTLKQKVVEFQ